MKFRRPRKIRNQHLPLPRDFQRPFDPQKRLDQFFLRTETLPVLEVLQKLKEQFGIGGALPYLAIRPADDERGPMIVVRDSDSGDERSTGVSAEGLTEEQIRLHPTARAELVKYATDEKLLRLQAQLSSSTVRYSRILRWWLERIRPAKADPLTERNRRRLSRKRRMRDPHDVFEEHCAQVHVLVMFFEDRRLVSHTRLVGDEFKKWRRDQCLSQGAELVRGQVKGAMDGTIQQYHSRLAKALEAFADVFSPPVRLDFKRTYGKIDYQHRVATGFKWSEVLRVVFFCLGYIWNEDGFAWDWIDIEGERREALLRLPADQLELHLLEYLCVLRTVLIYLVTGTRLDRIATLGWEPNDWRGWLVLTPGDEWIIRNGELGPNYENKPRNPSRLLPLAARLFRRFLAQDRRQREQEQWDDVADGGFYVAHNGRGGMVEDLASRLRTVYRAVGISHRNHDLKSASVGTFWEAGIELARIARLIGNDPTSTEEDYLFLSEDSEGVFRPSPDLNTLSFLNFADPRRLCRRLPRASRPGLPPELVRPARRRRTL